MELLEPGTAVKVTELGSAPELTGKTAKIVAFIAEWERYHLKLDEGGDDLYLQSSNIEQIREDEPGEPVVENMTDTLRAMVGMGLSVGQIETMLSGIGLNRAYVRSECERFVGSPSISLQRQSSIGLELLQDPQGDNDTLVDQVVASLESELEDPPERFCDPVSYNLMNEPMVIETGHVFDKSTLYDENGNFRFDVCPMTREEIQPLAFPIVFLKKELIDYKIRRLDAVLNAAERLPSGGPRSALLTVGKKLLDQLGSRIYIHRARKYWTLRLDLDGGRA